MKIKAPISEALKSKVTDQVMNS